MDRSGWRDRGVRKLFGGRDKVSRSVNWSAPGGSTIRISALAFGSPTTVKEGSVLIWRMV